MHIHNKHNKIHIFEDQLLFLHSPLPSLNHVYLYNCNWKVEKHWTNTSALKILTRTLCHYHSLGLGTSQGPNPLLMGTREALKSKILFKNLNSQKSIYQNVQQIAKCLPQFCPLCLIYLCSERWQPKNREKRAQVDTQPWKLRTACIQNNTQIKDHYSSKLCIPGIQGPWSFR